MNDKFFIEQNLIDLSLSLSLCNLCLFLLFFTRRSSTTHPAAAVAAFRSC